MDVNEEGCGTAADGDASNTVSSEYSEPDLAEKQSGVTVSESTSHEQLTDERGNVEDDIQNDNEEPTASRSTASQWVKQYDPSSQQVYFYNLDTGLSQWEQPHDFVDGIEDPKTNGAVMIQSIYRSKKARDEVKSRLRSGEVTANGECLWDAGDTGGNDSDERAGDGAEDGGALAEAVADEDQQSSMESSLDLQSDQDAHQSAEAEAAISIQCAFRQHAAGKTVESKRNHLRDVTDPNLMTQKINDLMRAMDEIQREIASRQLISAAEKQDFPHLQQLVVSWTESFEVIKDRVLGLPHRAAHIQTLELAAEKIVQANFFRETMAETRSECLAMLRSIFLMNSYFVELDVKRINETSATVQKWKAHELCALADPRIMKVVQIGDLQEIFSHVESTLRRAMGMTDFNTGSTTAAGKRYEEWHAEVMAALESVRVMEQRLIHKIQLLHMVRAAQVEKKEVVLMEIEDFNSSQIEMQQRKHASQSAEYARFLAKCRESWQSGLEKRHNDALEIRAVEEAKIEATARKMEIVEQMHKRDYHRRTTTTLSIWEAVKEGLPVDIIRAMVFAEMQKARRLGYDFELRTSRSDHGETLIQIACWWGHEHLLTFLIEEGANVHDLDSNCNKFSLLHDAARRGNAEVIRILLQNGLKHDIVDNSGDTPLHWAARKNHYEAVHTLLEAHVPCAEQNTLDVILTTVRAKNHRGKTPYQVAKNECVRRLVQAFDDGRLPLFRHPRTLAPTDSHRRMTDFPQKRTASSRFISGDAKGMARTHSLKNFPVNSAHDGGGGYMPEDEFGIINVLTPRNSEAHHHQAVRRASSNRSVNK